MLTQHLGDLIDICPSIHKAVLVAGRQLSQEDDGNLVTHHHTLSESRQVWHVAYERCQVQLYQQEKDQQATVTDSVQRGHKIGHVP